MAWKINKTQIASTLIGAICTLYTNQAYCYETTIESGTMATIKNIAANIPDTNSSSELRTTVAMAMLGKPYSYYLLDKKTPEYLFISTEHTDCMLFVEHVLVISNMISQHQINESQLSKDIVAIRYHGEINYCNRNNYFTDWATSNIKKQNMSDVLLNNTPYLMPNKVSILSTMEQNPNNLHHDELKCISQREIWVNQQKLGFIPIDKFNQYSKLIQDGDIIGVARKESGIDIAHMGIAKITESQVGMIHASSEHHEVMYSNNLYNYLINLSNIQGIVVLRPKEKINE